jgi:uncharacterized membrane protein YagU involved in acid resistance
MKGSRPLPIIAFAGLIAGILDITSAFVIAEIKGMGSIRMLQGIASGLLGPPSFEGGMATAGLGLAIHFLIAFTAAAVFYVGSRQIDFLTRHAVVSGLLYGIAVYVFMYWIVVPLRFPSVHHSVSRDLTAVIIHMILIGLTIALVVRHFSKQQSLSDK